MLSKTLWAQPSFEHAFVFLVVTDFVLRKPETKSKARNFFPFSIVVLRDLDRSSIREWWRRKKSSEVSLDLARICRDWTYAMKVVWAGSPATFDVAHHLSRLVAADPVCFCPVVLLQILLVVIVVFCVCVCVLMT